MTKNKNILSRIIDQISGSFGQADELVNNEDFRDLVLRSYGISEDLYSNFPISSLITKFGEISTKLSQLRNKVENGLAGDLSSIKSLFEDIKEVSTTVTEIQSVISNSSLTNEVKTELSSFWSEILDAWVVMMIRENTILGSICELLDIIKPSDAIEPTAEVYDSNNNLIRHSYKKVDFFPEKLTDFINNPKTYLQNLFQVPAGNPVTNEAAAKNISDRVFPLIERLFNGLGAFSYYGITEEEEAALSGHELELLKRTFTSHFYRHENINFGISMLLSHLLDDNLGLVIYPFGTLSFEQEINDKWKAGVEITSGVEAVSIGPTGIQFSNSSPNLRFDSSLWLRSLPQDINDSTWVIGNESKTHFSINHFLSQFKVGADSQGYEYLLSIILEKCQFVISPTDSDGFIAKILEDNGLNNEFDLELGYGSKRGLYFGGSGSLEVKIDNHKIDKKKNSSLILKHVILSIVASNDGISLQGGASFEINIGSLKASVNEIGISANVDFPGSGGNMGKIDVGISFKPPTGVGISIDAGSVSGGGFIKNEVDNKRYIGFLELKINKITLKVMGILNTELPGGEQGYSLLLIVQAEGFNPIQLGYGFALTGVGGLLGLNRTANLDILRDGIRTGGMENILFPKDIVKNADTIISTLSQSFPTKKGRFMVGPMAKIGWGAGPDKIVNIDLGLLIELPKPVIIAILGVVRVVLPPVKEGGSEENSKIVLKIAFLGVIDFGKKQISFDASIYDSRITTFTLFGDMAFRLYYGDNANFLMSVGGFHPSYTPPPMNLPELRRLTVCIVDNSNAKVSLESYFAVTSNTVQVGAKLFVYAAAGPFNATGVLWMDALFQFSPFYFIVDMGGAFAIRKGTKELLSAGIRLTLQGPSPWKGNGEVTFKILRFKKSIRVKFEFGKKVEEQIEDVAILADLQKTIDNKDNWLILNDRNNQLVTLRKTEESADPFLHPIGRIGLSQTLVPLNYTMNKFGDAKPKDYDKFYFTDFTINGDSINQENLKDSFAPSLFTKMNDEQKLASPSFEKLNSGFKLGTDKIESSHFTKRHLKYDPVIIDRTEKIKTFDVFETSDMFENMQNMNAVSKFNDTGKHNNKPHDVPNQVGVKDNKYSIRNRADQTAYNAQEFVSYVEAQSYLNSLFETAPEVRGTVTILANSEL